MKKLFFSILVTVVFVSFNLVAQEDTEESTDSFPTGTTITGIVNEVGDGMVVIDGVVYWLSAEIDPSMFVVGEGDLPFGAEIEPQDEGRPELPGRSSSLKRSSRIHEVPGGRRV